MAAMQNEMDSETYRMAVRQLEIAAERLDLEPGILERLRSPMRCMVVSVPVRLDNGETRVFVRLPGASQSRAGARERWVALSSHGHPR